VPALFTIARLVHAFGDPEIIQMSIVRISTRKSACVQLWGNVAGR
jgi:hypothetical protein